jgi:hypothetical protein
MGGRTADVLASRWLDEPDEGLRTVRTVLVDAA